MKSHGQIKQVKLIVDADALLHNKNVAVRVVSNAIPLDQCHYNTNVGEPTHSDINIAAWPTPTFQSSNITVPIPSETEDNNKHKGLRYHRLNNALIAKRPVLFDTDIGSCSSAKAPNMDYTDVVPQHSILPADTPSHVDCSLQSHTNVSICHTKDKLDSYQQLKNCTKEQQSQSCQPRQNLSASQQSATISKCNKPLQPSTHAKCLLQCMLFMYSL
ncbi:hypothetical protein Tco_1207957 [Tanacetum coccineum]